LEVEEEAQIII
jgi:hypothetical protein